MILWKAIQSDIWSIWVAEENGMIVSNIYIELIHKVPRPGRITHPFAYMTNVYTKPDYRGKGIGSKLISKINEWAKENKYEFIIVWPSDEGVDFTRKMDISTAKSQWKICYVSKTVDMSFRRKVIQEMHILHLTTF